MQGSYGKTLFLSEDTSKQRYDTGIEALKTAFLCNLWKGHCQKISCSRNISRCQV